MLYVCRLEPCPRPFPYPVGVGGMTAHLRSSHGGYTNAILAACKVDPGSDLARLAHKRYNPLYGCPMESCLQANNRWSHKHEFIRHFEDKHPGTEINNEFLRQCVVNFPVNEESDEYDADSDSDGYDISINGNHSDISLDELSPQPPVRTVNQSVSPALLHEIQTIRNATTSRQSNLKAQIQASMDETSRLRAELEETLKRQDQLASLAMLVHLGREGHDVGAAIKTLLERLTACMRH